MWEFDPNDRVDECKLDSEVIILSSPIIINSFNNFPLALDQSELYLSQLFGKSMHKEYMYRKIKLKLWLWGGDSSFHMGEIFICQDICEDIPVLFLDFQSSLSGKLFWICYLSSCLNITCHQLHEIILLSQFPKMRMLVIISITALR